MSIGNKVGVGSVVLMVCTSASAQGAAAVDPRHRWLTFVIFGVLFALSLLITYFASRRNHTAADFYTAGGEIGPLRNGLAIAGDYLSAAAFLGVSGLIALYGFDGISYLIGFFIAFIPVLLLVAEPCRNLGRYTLGDVLAYRNGFRSTKVTAALSSIIVALFYMVPQIVGGAVIIRALVGIRYETSVVAVGLLMLIYVAFGGMRATTAVQVIKAILLISCCFILVVLSGYPYGFDPDSFFGSLVADPKLQQHLAHLLPAGQFAAGADAGQRFLEPGLYLKSPLEQVSLGLALVLGTAAMPHVLMRFFAVRNARAARESVLWSMLAIGVGHLLIIAIGFAAALYIGADAIQSVDRGGNLAAPLLAQYLGGGADTMMGNFMLAFVAAIAFATIVAVVAGLTLAAASALAHDVYVGAICDGKATARQQMAAARIATLFMAVVSVVAGIAAKGQNVAQLVGLGYAVAASANLPALLLSLYWRKCNTAGVLAGIVSGTMLSIGLVLVSPNMTYPLQQKAAAQRLAQTYSGFIDAVRQGRRSATPAQVTAWESARDQALNAVERIPENATSIIGLKAPLLSLRNPGLISIPVGFFMVILFSLATADSRARSLWKELAVRRETGIRVS